MLLVTGFIHSYNIQNNDKYVIFGLDLSLEFVLIWGKSVILNYFKQLQ